jgi:riboflavin synthase
VFTGLVEEVGQVVEIRRSAGAKLIVQAEKIASASVVGDSISVNGACLTVTNINGDQIAFDVVEETLSRTTLGELKRRDRVNLERSISAERLFGGHFVLGHIDGVGTVSKMERQGGSAVIKISADEEIMRYVVTKGSIAVDGISLTIADCDKQGFSIAIIPHTLENTTLGYRRVGDRVNIETDILGKYVEKFINEHRADSRLITKLKDGGWIEEN